MEKLKKFCKKPLLLSSLVLVLVFVVGLIIKGIIPYAKANYKYDESSMGVSITMELDLRGNNATFTGNFAGEIMSSEGKFLVRDGYFYFKENGETSYEKMGIINAYELKLDIPYDDEDPTASITIKLKCGVTNAFRVIDIIMVVIGCLGFTVSLTYILYIQKHSQNQMKLETELK